MNPRPDLSGVVPATPETIQRAAELLLAGELVIIPTDTLYGVAARADSPAALARLYAAKQRPPEKRTACLVADTSQLQSAGVRLSAAALRLAERYWPGPLTLVMPGPTGEREGYRVPDHPIALAWLRALGPVLPAVTSANLSGQPPAQTAQEAWAALAPHVALALDAGPSPGGCASTVVALDGSHAEILREGPVTATDIRLALHDIP